MRGKTLALSILGAAQYSPTYVSTDLSAIVIDFIGTYFVQLVAFAGLIALVVLAVWFRRRGGNIIPGM